MEKDPKDSNIRIAPSFPTPEEMSEAAELFVLCTKISKCRKASLSRSNLIEKH